MLPGRHPRVTEKRTAKLTAFPLWLTRSTVISRTSHTQTSLSSAAGEANGKEAPGMQCVEHAQHYLHEQCG